MLDFSRDIHSLTDFKTRTPKFLAQLRKPERAILLTINGKAELAVMSAATFQRLLDRLEALDARNGVLEGLDDVAAGRTRPAEEFLAEMRSKPGPPESGG